MSLTLLPDAFEKVMSKIQVISSEKISVAQALGRVCADDIQARVTQPPQAVSSMDGYAVIADDVQDLGIMLENIGMSQAGAPFEGTLASGQTVRIFTGAALPDLANAVIMQEDCTVDGNQVTFNEVAFDGKFVRPAGLDFKEGDVLVSKGTVITARHIGLICAMNVPWVSVYRKPKVAVLATGDELVMPGETVRPSQIISSNSLMVCAMIEAMGAEAINLGIAKDSEASLQSMVNGIQGADILVTTGGVSVGEFDLVRQVLGDNGLDIDLYRIAMKPGKPFMFGHIQKTPVMGLPGNPVSSYVTAYLFLRAALLKMQGGQAVLEQGEPAILTADIPANFERQEYVRAVISTDDVGHLTVKAFDRQDSSMLGNLAHCNGFIIRPPHSNAQQAGDRVQVIRLGGSMVSL
jgi:molybdopterin molybdotransferase